jgi:transposase
MKPRSSLQPLDLSSAELSALESIARRRTVSRQLSERVAIILACAGSHTNSQVARLLGVSQPTVGKWRKRFLVSRIAGLSDEPRSGTPRRVAKALVDDVVHRTLSTKPANAVRWTSRAMATAVGLSSSSVLRIWRVHGVAVRSTHSKRPKGPLASQKRPGRGGL